MATSVVFCLSVYSIFVFVHVDALHPSQQFSVILGWFPVSLCLTSVELVLNRG